jgi:hypothetical protein
MYFTIYKITNKINGKFYIGSHKTKNLDDNYMGSGKYLKYAQEKYGISNFEKKILYVFDNSKDMYIKEAEIVNEDFISTENTYNLKVGGYGGFDYINENNLNWTLEKNKSISGFKQFTSEERSVYSSMGGKARNDINFGARIKKTYPHGTFGGKFHSDETKKIIGEKNSINQSNKKNSQFGTMWITNGVCNKKIKNYQSIPDGWNRGRKIK